jgi:transcriptional regulator with XRE-family HTH domain
LGERWDSPALRRRRLGAALRRHREAAGLTIDVVANRLACSPSKISRIETGHTRASADDVRTILTFCRVAEAEVHQLVEIAERARERPWWASLSSSLSGAFIGLEAAAYQIRSYETMCVPGLLQTEAYARCVIGAGGPFASDVDVEGRVKVRIARKALLHGDEPAIFRTILDEAVLMRPVGGQEVMRGQLEHLVELASLPNVSVRVLPFDAGAHPGMEGSFVILNSSHEADPGTVFVAMATGGVFQERPTDLHRYETIFKRLWAASLPRDVSSRLLTRRAKES